VWLLETAAVFCGVLVAVQFAAGCHESCGGDLHEIDRYEAGVRELGRDKIIIPDLTPAEHALGELRLKLVWS
jgi:hypothetical protein